MPKTDDYSLLSDEELMSSYKKLKQNELTSAVLVGLFIGIAVYSTVKNGFEFFTVFPLIFVYILNKNSVRKKQITAEIESRNLN